VCRRLKEAGQNKIGAILFKILNQTFELIVSNPFLKFSKFFVEIRINTTQIFLGNRRVNPKVLSKNVTVETGHTVCKFMMQN